MSHWCNTGQGRTEMLLIKKDILKFSLPLGSFRGCKKDCSSSSCAAQSNAAMDCQCGREGTSPIWTPVALCRSLSVHATS